MKPNDGVSAFWAQVRAQGKDVGNGCQCIHAEYAIAQADGALVMQESQLRIPAGSWRRLRPDTLADPMTTTGAVAVGDHGTHLHDVVRPLALAPFQPGDQVAVLWLLGLTEPLVLGVVVEGA